MGKFVVRTAPTGFSFHLAAANGQVIGASQVYNAEKSCRAGIESVRKIAADAALEDQTAEGCEKLKNPKFEVYADKKGEVRFRLKARNGEIVLASEGYKSKASCLKGVQSVRKNAPEAAVVDEK